jgi:hypothetical protein
MLGCGVVAVAILMGLAMQHANKTHENKISKCFDSILYCLLQGMTSAVIRA